MAFSSMGGLAIAADLGVDQPIEGWDRRSASRFRFRPRRGRRRLSGYGQGEARCLAVEYADPGQSLSMSPHDAHRGSSAMRRSTLSLSRSPHGSARLRRGQTVPGASCPKVDSPGTALA